jgi:serine/threonine protein kinase
VHYDGEGNIVSEMLHDFPLIISSLNTTKLTHSCCGRGYMPPEFIQGILTSKSDIFSLGVIIMEVVTGQRNYLEDATISSEEFIELVCEIFFISQDRCLFLETIMLHYTIYC